MQNYNQRLRDGYNNPPEKVELIASGYEWICPICEAIHKEIEVKSKVRCDICKKSFEVNDYYHALEG